MSTIVEQPSEGPGIVHEPVEDRPWTPFPPELAKVVAQYHRPESARPTGGTIPEVAVWLGRAVRQAVRAVELFDELAWRIAATGLPLVRFSVHVGTLHPVFLGLALRWHRRSEMTEQVMVFHEVRDTPAYQDSPIRHVNETGETVRRRLEDAACRKDYPILDDLRAEGMTDYLVMAIPGHLGQRYVATFATDRPGGFSEQDLADFERLSDAISLGADIIGQRQIARNLLNAYLGPKTGPRVLDGLIRRGQGEEMRAVLWTSDLRAFTRLSDRLTGEQTIALLNALFDAQAGIIAHHGGEILKFMGDGLLVIFPIDDAGFAGYAARNALEAAEKCIAAIAALPAGLAGEPLRGVVALHVGDVVYGNIGAADRLDFTVIGPAVNLVTRVESVAKMMDLPIVVSDDFVAAYGRPMASVGMHRLRGLSQAHELFTTDAIAATANLDRDVT